MAIFVSILIPCFNAARWVHRAIESALAQTWPEKEVIVLDDASVDGSMEAIRPYRGRIRIESSSNNGGQNVSRNRLTAMSRGEWLVYLDSDDELAPDSVEQRMKQALDADVIYGSTEIATFHGSEKVGSTKIVAADYSDPWTAAFAWRFPNTTAFLFRRSAVVEAGGWNEGIKNCTDYDLYFRLLLRGCRFQAAADAWSLYRQWSLTQAVNEVPLRAGTTRLSVMRAAAEALKKNGQLTRLREQAFLDASLGVLRLLYSLDQTLAVKEYRRLIEWNPNFSPSASVFPTRYLWAYRLLGFAPAERIAAMLRRRKPVPG